MVYGSWEMNAVKGLYEEEGEVGCWVGGDGGVEERKASPPTLHAGIAI